MENENVKTANRLDSEAIDLKIVANAPSTKFSDLFTVEQHDIMRKFYCDRFDKAWKNCVNCANIAVIRGVSTSSVVSYFNNDVENRTAHIAETIEAIGAGKPKMTLVEKLKKSGFTKSDIEKMLANWDE